MCQTSIVYERRLNGTTLEFGHAGILYRDSFVMYDRETDSLWVHVTGRAEVGPREGWQLTFMPSTVTTWAEWKRLHPHTEVLVSRRRGGFMGTYTGVDDPGGIGLAVIVWGQAKLYPFDLLAEASVVNDTVHGASVVVAYSESTGTARAWGREVDGRTLTFERGQDLPGGTFLLQDQETGSAWSWLTGEAVSGELAGTRLEHASHHPILSRRFAGFYPDGPVME